MQECESLPRQNSSDFHLLLNKLSYVLCNSRSLSINIRSLRVPLKLLRIIAERKRSLFNVNFTFSSIKNSFQIVVCEILLKNYQNVKSSTWTEDVQTITRYFACIFWKRRRQNQTFDESNLAKEPKNGAFFLKAIKHEQCEPRCSI